MKKFFIWTLTVLMLLSMVACNQPADPQEQPTEAPTTAPAEGGTETPTTNGDDKPSEPDDSPLAGAPTYDNSEFTVMFRPDNRFINPVLVKTIEANATSLDRVVYERMILIEEALQIKFDIVRAEDYNKDMISSFSNYAKTGVDALDLANVHGRNVPWNLAISKSLYDWNDLAVDLDATYWSQNAKEEFSTAGGKLYFLTGDANYLTVGTAFSMFFNKEMVNNVNGLEMPYQLVRDGEWTFEVFENYVTTIYSNLDGTGTGVLGEDSFGYVTPHTRGPVSILYSTGNSLLTKSQNEPNGYKYTVYKEVISKAMNDYVDLVLKSGSSLYFRVANADVKAQMHTAFIGGVWSPANFLLFCTVLAVFCAVAFILSVTPLTAISKALLSTFGGCLLLPNNTSCIASVLVLIPDRSEKETPSCCRLGVLPGINNIDLLMIICYLLHPFD